MSWHQNAAILPRPPDQRPIGQIEQEIIDELQFHIEMRTIDNAKAGMGPDEAREEAVRRFGDFERIHKACRKTLLGERIMLQRIQTALMLVLTGAVIFLGVAFYLGQQANREATAAMMQKNEVATRTMLDHLQLLEYNLEKTSSAAVNVAPCVTTTVPKYAETNVDPSLKEIRATFNKPMLDKSWSWCYDLHELKKTGEPRFEADGKTCVLPVKLEPGKTYTIWLNSENFNNFKDTEGQSAIPYALQFTTRK
jgi:hypothetical protein